MENILMCVCVCLYVFRIIFVWEFENSMNTYLVELFIIQMDRKINDPKIILDLKINRM